MSSAGTQDNWWQSFYEDTPLDLYLARTDEEELKATLAFLIERLALPAGGTVFDQCCGLGDLSIPLAERGYSVIGVDLCGKYIAAARAKAERKNLPAKFVAADACQFVPDTKCDAAFNWYTSFGYFSADSENLKMLLRAREAIKPGGWFVLEFANIPMILRNFKPMIRSSLASPEGEIEIVRECSIDLHSGMMHQRWTFKRADGTKTVRDTSLRAYMPADIVRLFREAGFEEIQLFGSVKGEPLTVDSARLLCLGRKPLAASL